MQSDFPRTVRYLFDRARPPSEHEEATHRFLAMRLAELLALPYGGEWTEPAASHTAYNYLIPCATLSCAQASALGVRCADDLFGGVVPAPHTATKVITHELVSAGAAAPPGWCKAFPAAVRDVVLPGFSVFDRDDLAHAATGLLDKGRVRVKQPDGIGGEGQQVIDSGEKLRALLRELTDEQSLAREGLVIEDDLTGVVTFSVGQLQLGGISMSYYGSQHSTPNDCGEAVYGGSDLWCVRGGFDELEKLHPDANARLAIEQARVYHGAALRCFPGIILSRANYDVAQGWDAQGHWRSGVLEQSWRAGGASAAEVEAVAVLQQQPQRPFVHTRTVERYGAGATAPHDAIVSFRGRDSGHGPAIKYAQVIPDAAA